MQILYFVFGYLIFAWIVGRVLNALLERLLDDGADSSSSSYSELRALAAESKVVSMSARRAKVKRTRTDSADAAS